MHWLSHVLGMDNLSGPFYGWWSGAGSDIGEVVLIGGFAHWYRSRTCHVDHPKFCWRPGAHPVDGTPYRVCKKHHPRVPDKVTAAHIVTAHRKAQVV